MAERERERERKKVEKIIIKRNCNQAGAGQISGWPVCSKDPGNKNQIPVKKKGPSALSCGNGETAEKQDGRIGSYQTAKQHD